MLEVKDPMREKNSVLASLNYRKGNNKDSTDEKTAKDGEVVNLGFESHGCLLGRRTIQAETHMSRC